MTTAMRRPLVPLLAVVCAGGMALTACSGVSFVAQDTPAQEACKEYAQAFIDGESREAITAGMERAVSTARGSSSNDAQAVAAAIETVLTQSVIGTNESLAQANDQVIRACDSAGVTMEMVD